MTDLTLKDFYPVNNWVVDEQGPKWDSCGCGRVHPPKPKYLTDETTGKKFWNEDKGVVRFKCALLTLGTPVVHAVASVINVAMRILKLVTLFHFWFPKEGEKSYNFTARLKDAGWDMVRIIFTPAVIPLLEASAFYGLASPYNARKLYSSFETFFYQTFILAPCFQPDPKAHALGGNPNQQNAF